MLMRLWPKPRPVLAPGWNFTTRNASTRASAIAHRGKFTRKAWIWGRLALPTGCASPASRASSEGEEMLTFAHIPTGTTVNKAIKVDDSKSRAVAPATAPTMIGADIETGGATP